MNIIAKLFGGLIKSVVVGTFNTIIYVAAKITAWIYYTKLLVEHRTAVLFRRSGEMLPDGSYEPELVYAVYEMEPDKFGFQYVGEMRVSPTDATFYPEVDPDDEVRIKFSKCGWLNPLTLREDRGRWLRLAAELFYIASDGVRVEEIEEDSEESSSVSTGQEA